MKKYSKWDTTCPQCGKPIIFFTLYRIRTDDIKDAKYYKCVSCGNGGSLKKQLTLDEDNFIKEEK